MGRLAWEPSQWPSPEKMLRRLKKQGVNLVAISQPYVLRNGRALDNYNELSPKGMFGKDSEGKTKDVTIWVGEGGMFDVSNPDTRAWLRERYRILTDGGITGWWGCHGRSNTTYDERLELEYYYVKNCSLWMDALTVIKTAVVLIKRDGAK